MTIISTGHSLTKETFSDLPVTTCATRLLTVPGHIFKSAKIASEELDIRIKAFGCIIVYDKADYWEG
jgi:hypothetical protein